MTIPSNDQSLQICLFFLELDLKNEVLLLVRGSKVSSAGALKCWGQGIPWTCEALGFIPGTIKKNARAGAI